MFKWQLLSIITPFKRSQYVEYMIHKLKYSQNAFFEKANQIKTSHVARINNENAQNKFPMQRELQPGLLSDSMAF